MNVIVSWVEVAGPHILVDMFALCEIIVLWSLFVTLMVSSFYSL